jgi:hypothetical protein
MNRDELKTKAINAAFQMLQSNGYISAVDVLMAMGKLSRDDHDRWRVRQVPYLERVIRGNLAQFEVLLRAVRTYSRDQLHLKPSRTVYTSWGKGPRQPLRFTRSGIPYLEEMYSTHFVGAAPARTIPITSPPVPEVSKNPKPTPVISEPGATNDL